MIHTGDSSGWQFEEVKDIIQPGVRFLLTCHVNPDGDALGSLLALAEGLRHKMQGNRRDRRLCKGVQRGAKVGHNKKANFLLKKL